MILEIRTAIEEKIRWQNSRPGITEVLKVLLPHQTRSFGPAVPVVQAVPRAGRTVGPAQRFKHGELLQYRNARRSGRRDIDRGRRAIGWIEVTRVWSYFARSVIGQVGVS